MKETNLPKRIANIIVFNAFWSFLSFLHTLENSFIDKIHSVSILSFLTNLFIFLKFFAFHFLNKISYLFFWEIAEKETIHTKKQYSHISILFFLFTSFYFYGSPRWFFWRKPISFLSASSNLFISEKSKSFIIHCLEYRVLIFLIRAVILFLWIKLPFFIPKPFCTELKYILWLWLSDVWN